VSQELLARSPKNVSYLEIAAVSGEALGVLEKALQNYETIYLLTGNVNSLYKIAFLQYDLKRFAESLTNADILLTKPEINTEKIYFTDQANKSKEYPMKVAVLNLKGLIQLEQNDKPAAKKSFEECLAIAPDFELAKQNLSKVK
jgi:tetratricopeptide (TPR) repeat protein